MKDDRDYEQRCRTCGAPPDQPCLRDCARFEPHMPCPWERKYHQANDVSRHYQGEVERLKRRLEAKNVEHVVALALLRRLEWMPSPMPGYPKICLDCHNYETEGHESVCVLKAALEVPA